MTEYTTTTLLPEERIALAYLHERPQYRSAKPKRLSDFDKHEWALALESLNRFGLTNKGYKSDWGDTNECGWFYSLNDAGLAAHKQIQAYIYRCCEHAVHLECVCSECTACPIHDGGCHGTHD